MVSTLQIKLLRLHKKMIARFDQSTKRENIENQLLDVIKRKEKAKEFLMFFFFRFHLMFLQKQFIGKDDIGLL